MSDEEAKQSPATRFDERVGAQERRKARARRKGGDRIWLGFAAFGLIGWSVAVPTLLGIALGVWLDRRFPGRLSWTLMLLALGLGVGCLNAWHWVSREHRALREENEDHEGD
jgi:ATP synthase protein I